MTHASVYVQCIMHIHFEVHAVVPGAIIYKITRFLINVDHFGVFRLTLTPISTFSATFVSEVYM